MTITACRRRETNTVESVDLMTELHGRNMTGERVGKLLVIGFVGTRVWVTGNKAKLWHCQCDCGNQTIVSQKGLASGNSKSCGCNKSEANRKTHTTHGFTRNRKVHPGYASWRCARDRCERPKNKCYRFYGARGIKVCERWLSFEAFWEDMGPTWQEGLTLERKDVNGNYEPGNCEWIPLEKQASNTRKNRKLEFAGRTQNVMDWAREFGMNESAIRHRLDNLGWSVEKALTAPSRYGNTRKIWISPSSRKTPA